MSGILLTFASDLRTNQKQTTMKKTNVMETTASAWEQSLGGEKNPKIRVIHRERDGKAWYNKVHTVHCIEREGHGGDVMVHTRVPDRQFGELCTFLLLHKEWIEPLNRGEVVKYYGDTYQLLKSGGKIFMGN